MTDLHPVLDVMVSTLVNLTSSEKNYSDFLTHLINSLFSQNKFSSSTSSISTSHLILITNSNNQHTHATNHQFEHVHSAV